MLSFRNLSIDLLIVIVGLSYNAQAADFDDLGDLGGGNTFSQAFAVSDDGSVVVGRSDSSNGTEAFRWVDGSGMEDPGLGDLTGGNFSSEAFGVSADGSVIVGKSLSGSGTEAFRWVSGSGMSGLSDLTGGNFSSEAFGVSADGSVVVGRGSTASGPKAFRWTSSGLTDLGDLTGGRVYSAATGVSADGSIVVGMSMSDNGIEAFNWVSGSGMEDPGLGDLPGGPFMSMAEAVSMVSPVPDDDTNADGRVIVGSGLSGSGIMAMRYQNNVMRPLGDLSGGTVHSVAKGVSEDGSIIVGFGTDGSGRKAFIWDATNRMRDLKTVLEGDYGLTLTDWTLTEATAISPDGRVIVGYGVTGGYTKAWRAVIGRNDLEPDMEDPDAHNWDDEWSDAMSFVVLDANDKVEFEIIKYVWAEYNFDPTHCQTDSGGSSQISLEHIHFENDVDTTKADRFWDWYYDVNGTSAVRGSSATNLRESIAYAMDGYAGGANYDYWLVHGNGANQGDKVFSEDCDAKTPANYAINDRLAYDEGEDASDNIYDHVTIVKNKESGECGGTTDIEWKCSYSGVYTFNTIAAHRWTTPGRTGAVYAGGEIPTGTYDLDYWANPDIFRKKP